jgi:purine-cytosine permease-like protein
MAEGAARVDDLEQGALPAICAKTGVPCDGLVKDTLRVIPRWVPPLAILLIVPYFVARAYTSRRIEAKLPISPQRLERIRRLVRASWIALVAAAAGFSSLFFGAGVIGLGAFVAGLAAYLVVVYVGDQMWVGARPSPADDVVILTRVHPDFARALSPVPEAGPDA